jgi:hypothetical protein
VGRRWPRPGTAGPLLGSARSGGRVPTLARSLAMAPSRQYRAAGSDAADVGDTATAIDEPRAPTLGARLDGARLSSILATRRERAEQDYAQREREVLRGVAPRASVDHGVLNTLVDGVRQVDRVETQRNSWPPIPPSSSARHRPNLPIYACTHFALDEIRGPAPGPGATIIPRSTASRGPRRDRVPRRSLACLTTYSYGQAVRRVRGSRRDAMIRTDPCGTHA